MDNMFVNSVFAALFQVAENRSKKLQKYRDSRTTDESDDDCDSVHPVYDSYVLSVKPLDIHKMTNFNPAEIKLLFDYFQPISNLVLHRGRGNRCNFTMFDVLLMVLTVYRNGGWWDIPSSMFKIQSACF